MENTGRILHGLNPIARRILFGETADAAIDLELEYSSEVDRAHVVMLAERGVITRAHASILMNAINELRTCDFAPLRGQAAPRGLYLLYENYLIEKLGPEIGGVLQTARSRNDLNATILYLRLRKPYLRLIKEALRLQAVLLRRSNEFVEVVMPAYTHYQAAVPITYGHYLAGIATALSRDLAGIFDAGSGLRRCPLGAGAVGGTSLPIDQSRTASLLGFDEPAPHSIDAVASRDIILRLLGAAAILGVTLSRLSADLLIWTTGEFGFIALPDTLVGSSSMMPQKRNPFILEHVQGRSASALGAFVAAATAAHATPFTNSIAVGTEAVKHIWKALEEATEATTLMRLLVDAGRPCRQSMLDRAIEGYTSATELANRLMVEGGMPFRLAHLTVGAIIRLAIEQGGSPLEQAASTALQAERAVSMEGLDPTAVARRAIYGGGPGAVSLAACLKTVRAQSIAQIKRGRELAQKWRAAGLALDNAVKILCSNPNLS